MANLWGPSAVLTTGLRIPHGEKDCMIGFFECIQDERVALAMFEHVRKWATTHGLEALYGPFNLDYEDGYGVLVEGRDRPVIDFGG